MKGSFLQSRILLLYQLFSVLLPSMNDINLCYDKKFISDYGYPLYLFKRCQYLNCDNSYNICSRIKCMKIGCLSSLFSTKNRTENLKMFLQNTRYFFISNTFISNARLKLTKSQANAEQQPEAELLLITQI